MEAFNDLQRNWAKRFPHSKLSLIWEEDVRTLLSTHRQRVAQLREELEQEEFLVQYFERYLTDARHRSVARDNANHDNIGAENGDTGERKSNGVVRTSNGLPHETADKAQNLKQTLEKVPPVSDTPRQPEAAVNGTDEHGKPYVTVIAVSGFTAPDISAPSSPHGLDLEAQEALLARRRRKPPTPPPKRAKWPPPSQIAQLTQKEQQCSTPEPPAAVPIVPSEPESRHAEKPSVNSQPAFSTFRPACPATPGPHPPPAQPQAPPPPRRETPVATVDVEEEDLQDGYDVIYDTVALDDEVSSSRGDDGISPEPDYVEFGKLERRTRRSFDDDSHGGGAATMESSSATYENIALLKASESMDSEEDDGTSSTMLRSMSSDADLDGGTATTGSDHSSGGGGRTDRSRTEELLDVDSGVYSSSVESASFLSTSTPPARKRGNRDIEQQNVSRNSE